MPNWARPRRLLRLLALALLAGAALAAAPASGTVLTPTPNPLPGGSNFQGADGNQDNASPFDDWQAIAGQVQHNPDPNAQDSAFEGGTKRMSRSTGISPPRRAV